MDQLIEELVSKAGLTAEQAVKAIAVIKDYITGQLPPMMHGVVDGFLRRGQGEIGTGEEDVLD